MVGNADLNLKGVLITLDTTEGIINEAIEKNCNLIVSFHPIIFSGIKKLTTNISPALQKLMKQLKIIMNLFLMHTSLDNHNRGVNYKISEKIGLKNSKILVSNKENISIGIIKSEKKRPRQKIFRIY